MAFLFKSKKSQDRALSSRDGNSGSQGSIQSASSRMARDEKNALAQRSTPTGSLNSLDNDGSVGSPDRGHGRRGGSVDNTQASDLPLRNGPQPTNPNASLYPWSQRRLTYTTSHPSPFPRYGAAVNATSSKEGDIYMMGGLINSSTVKGDLWMIEAGGNMACYPLATTAEGPGPRVGHASLLVGNAFIVYGGDTKIEESDALDETLYLLNTWRYGHSLNILGSKIFIFGGQVEGHFMNDLSAFDLNQLQMPNNRWEILLPAESSPRAPAARTNHSMVTYNDKMYLFGGTNGYQWFNDVWCYDPAVNTWTQLDCIGYIPAPREGHAASLVDDVMYVFGGRTEEGSDLGDLAAFRISTRRWYTFQNMGPSPSSRSGHSMTTVGKSIVVLGGEPSSAASAINDLGILYVLDTSKIRYPNDSQPGAQKITQGRRPSASEVQNPPRAMPARDGSAGPTDSRKGSGGAIAPMVSPTNGHKSPPPGGDLSASPISGGPGAAVAKPRAALTSSPAGPPPTGPTPAKPTGDQASSLGRVRGPSADRAAASAVAQGPVARDAPPETVAAAVNGRRTPTHPGRGPVKQEVAAVEPPKAKQTRHGQSSGRSSGRNSQTVALLKELDAARNRNAWYASELELARKSGYVSSATFSPTLDAKAAETFDDEDRPLIEALLAMRTELANVQSAVDKQAVLSAKQIAEAEKQRDAAIQEAVYAKARLAAHSGGSASSTPQLDREQDDGGYREAEMSKKLASALHIQRSFQSQLENARSELEAEKKARKLADDTTNAAQRRMGDLETYKQQTSAEVERLKSELHLVQREARDQSVSCAEAVAALELLRIEKEDFATKYNEAVGSAKDHDESFQSLRDAIGASEDARVHLEQKLEEERAQRQDIEAKLTNLKAEHEARTVELASSTQRLRDAEELAERHASEAKTHRQAVLAGLDKISARDVSGAGKADTERLTALQNQVTAANALVKKYQQEADGAAAKLRSAEERIAGLEQYQEQASREGVTIRRQLQSSLREVQSLQAAHTDARNQLAAQQLETNAMTVQHNALKDILNERGISPTSAVRSRGLASPRVMSPEQTRMRDLEVQLASTTAAHEEVKQAFATQAQESELAYREKLSQLESDYQSAVHYVKGTEKMLKQLKDQLSRYKSDNARLKAELDELESRAQEGGERSEPPADWENERDALHKRIEGLETELRNSGAQLDKNLQSLRAELAESMRQRDEATKSASSQRKDLEQLQSENALLEQRATDAEQKVSLLLDQVEHSVDSYRRRSRQIPAEAVAEIASSSNGLGGHGHARSESSETESAYGGNGLDARNSAALDNLASELETLRSHWEATNKNYRLSTNFDFDQPTPVGGKKDDDSAPGASLGLSESLADWRKRLDTDDHQAGPDKSHQH
ncbi:kelch-domain-containing protein [Purpureocillium lavendulum]|uniref:Kelch-domain-containing protein n=1 Tax=Purpureocillium lavendulum TaxID=1247861 RepID=A0AB34FZW9_9HYPO|nr:kelch-domain-containing protein [Purpureocillium lavendulum]